MLRRHGRRCPPRFEGEQSGQCTRPCGCRGRKPGPAPPVGVESDKHLFPESCLQDDWTDDYAKSEALRPSIGL